MISNAQKCSAKQAEAEEADEKVEVLRLRPLMPADVTGNWPLKDAFLALIAETFNNKYNISLKYSLVPKLWTNCCFMKQNCYLQ